MSETALGALEPAGVWRRFLELTEIPRPPRGEERAREHVLAWAGANGLAHRLDAAGNAIVRVPASPGREDAPTVVLQSHLDMVCERDPTSPYDPRAGRLRVVRDDDWVRADGTTLGADNGIGVAAAMAVAEDSGVVHGPLELLFTVCEEEGLEGAKALDPALVSGRLLVNLDGSSDDAITVGCAGSAHTFVRLPIAAAAASPLNRTVRIALSGGRGGHSGADIAKGRANAIEVLGRLLREGHARVPLGLVALDGGVSRNAIPREAEALVSVPATAEEALRAALRRALEEARAEYAASDDGLVLAVDRVARATPAEEGATARVLGLLDAIPIGVVALSRSVLGAVETSTSLNVARTEDGVVTLASMTRSAETAGLDEVVGEIERVALRFGAKVETRRSYPPWTPAPGSRLLERARSTYEQLFGVVPSLEVVHGGLECAVIGEKLEGVEMIALGPRLEGPHAPGERLSISSTQRFYRLLGALLDDLSR